MKQPSVKQSKRELAKLLLEGWKRQQVVRYPICPECLGDLPDASSLACCPGCGLKFGLASPDLSKQAAELLKAAKASATQAVPELIDALEGLMKLYGQSRHLKQVQRAQALLQRLGRAQQKAGR